MASAISGCIDSALGMITKCNRIKPASAQIYYMQEWESIGDFQEHVSAY